MKKLLATLLIGSILLPQIALAVSNISPKNFLTRGLVAYWNFEGKNINWSTAKLTDLSGNGNTGDMIRYSTTSDAVAGVIGQGLKHRIGAVPIIQFPVSSSLNPTTGFTNNLWFKSQGNGVTQATQKFMVRDDGASNRIYQTGITNAFKMEFDLWDSGGVLKQLLSTGSCCVANQWQMLTYVWDGTTMSTYIDGVKDSGTLAFSGTMKSGSIVSAFSDVNFPNGGVVDEVRLYNRGLSQQEITQLFTMGRDRLDISQRNFGKSGQLAHWTFDGKNTSWQSNTASDISGNGNTATLVSMSTTTSPRPGKLGQSLNFTSGGDYAVTSSDFVKTLPTFSVSAWIYPTSSSGDQAIVSDWETAPAQTFLLRTSSGGLQGFVFTSAQAGGAFNLTPPLEKWSHVVMTYDGTTIRGYLNGQIGGTTFAQSGTIANNGTRIGIGGPGFSLSDSAFIGKIDDVRIYNKALSLDEIQRLGSTGSDLTSSSVSLIKNGLVGHWTMDGKNVNWNSNTVSNSVSGGNSATMTGVSTTSAPTVGALGQGLKLTSGNDFLTVSNYANINPTSQISVSLWVKRYTNATGREFIINKGTCGSAATCQYSMEFPSNNTITFYLTDGVTDRNLNSVSTIGNLNQWHHVVGTYDGSTQKIYIDGKLANSASWSTSLNSLSADLVMGYLSSGFFYLDGAIDDVKIYNRALSDLEISLLANSR